MQCAIVVMVVLVLDLDISSLHACDSFLDYISEFEYR